MQIEPTSVECLPREMTAWTVREDRHGEPLHALRKERVEVPRPRAGEVILKIMAAGINYNGLWLCRGEPASLSRLRTGYDFHVPGSDASAVVVQVGDGVRRWKPGDEVVVHCNTSCGQCPACNGRDPLACEEQRIWGYETNWGAFAPFARVQAQQLLPKPPHLTWEEASSYGLCLFTAYRMLLTRARVSAGENVLVWGASGGLGVFAVQLCRLAGANAICVISSEEKAELCRSLGARWIINRSHFDLASDGGRREFGRAIRGLTGGQDPDVVFEHVGRATFATSVFVCAKMGRIVICGATSGYDLGLDARYLWMRQKTILGSHFANAHEAARANRLVEERKIQPVLTRAVSFEQLPQAQAAQGDVSHVGKLAVLIGAEQAGLGARR